MKNKATIITIGDELLIGQVLDTNSYWLSSELTSIGFSIINHVSISDNAIAIIETLNFYIKSSDLIIFTGGLGPTRDDITKKVLSEYFSCNLIMSPEVLSDVESFLTARSVPLINLNKDQALIPDKAIILRNKQGTAPGMWFEKDNKVVISLPGVPSETKGIYSDHIKNRLKERFTLPQIIYRTVMFTGIGESVLAQRIEQWENNLPESVTLAYLPSPGIVRLRLGITTNNRQEALSIINDKIEDLNSIIPEHIYGYDNKTLEEVIGELINGKTKKLAVAESCTGGSLAQMITAIPGCSKWFNGGIVAYSNDVKISVLGVYSDSINKYGAVSKQVVEEMVCGVLKITNSDYAIATSGIAGPDGGTIDKPVGTVWIAVAGPGFIKSQLFNFGNDRKGNIRRSTLAAFNTLRVAIIESK